MLLQSRGLLLNLGSQAVIRSYDHYLDVFVIVGQEVTNGLGSVIVEGSQSELEANLLLDNPGKSRLLNEDVLGQFSEQRRVKLVERFGHLQVAGEELVPAAVGLLQEIILSDVEILGIS